MAMASRFQTGTPSSPWWKLPSAHHLHDFTISFLSAHLPKAPDTSSDGAQVDRESSFSKAMCSGISEQVKWATMYVKSFLVIRWQLSDWLLTS